MTHEKRPRGRPRGSGKNDAPWLAQVADLVVREDLKPTTAMKRIIARQDWDATDTTLLRRWQVKWRADKDTLLAGAHERARPMSFQEMLETIAAIPERIQRLVDNVEQFLRQPGVRRFVQVIDNPATRQRHIEQAK